MTDELGLAADLLPSAQQVGPEDGALAVRRPDRSPEDSEESRLPGTVRTGEQDGLPAARLQADAGESRFDPEDPGHPVEEERLFGRTSDHPRRLHPAPPRLSGLEDDQSVPLSARLETRPRPRLPEVG